MFVFSINLKHALNDHMICLINFIKMSRIAEKYHHDEQHYSFYSAVDVKNSLNFACTHHINSFCQMVLFFMLQPTYVALASHLTSRLQPVFSKPHSSYTKFILYHLHVSLYTDLCIQL